MKTSSFVAAAAFIAAAALGLGCSSADGSEQEEQGSGAEAVSSDSPIEVTALPKTTPGGQNRTVVLPRESSSSFVVRLKPREALNIQVASGDSVYSYAGKSKTVNAPGSSGVWFHNDGASEKSYEFRIENRLPIKALYLLAFANVGDEEDLPANVYACTVGHACTTVSQLGRLPGTCEAASHDATIDGDPVGYCAAPALRP